MPTRRPRHMITETPPVERELRRLRALQPEGIDIKELVILGARAKAAELESEGSAEDEPQKRLVEEFITMRADGEVDAELALGLHESGWAH